MERAETSEGNELSFATNYLSRVLLNSLLLDLLRVDGHRLKQDGVMVNVINPGQVDTDIRRTAQVGGVMKLMLKGMEWMSRRSVLTAVDFSQVVLRLVTSPEFAQTTGGLFNNKGMPLKIRADRRDPIVVEHVWKMSHDRVGVKPPEAAKFPLERTS